MRLAARATWRWVVRLMDDALPMPPEQQRERDDNDRDHSSDRRRRLRLHALEKRGKGGCR